MIQEIKRFRIIDPSERTPNSRYNTIKEVVHDLYNNRDLGLQHYMVEDLLDEIEIDADELLEAWSNGERPEDLQMF